MAIQLNPYLSFRDTAQQAMTFYQSVFGGELTSNTFADYHASEDPTEQDKIMHSQLVTDDGLGADGGRHAEQHGVHARRQLQRLAQRR